MADTRDERTIAYDYLSYILGSREPIETYSYWLSQTDGWMRPAVESHLRSYLEMKGIDKNNAAMYLNEYLNAKRELMEGKV